MREVLIRFTEGVPNRLARAIAKLHKCLKEEGDSDFSYEVVLRGHLVAGSTVRHHIVTPIQNKEVLCLPDRK